MNKDILRYICLKLEPVDLINLTKCEKLSQKLDNNFWIEKLKKDFKIENVYNDGLIIYKELYSETHNSLYIFYERKYSDKLIEHLTQTGYIKKFEKEIFNLLGPFYGNYIDKHQKFWSIFRDFFEPYSMGDNIANLLLSDLLEDFRIKLGDESLFFKIGF